MIACDKCGAGMRDGAVLFRQNPKGAAGVWRCAACNTKPVDPMVADIVGAIACSACAMPRPDCMGAVVPGIGSRCGAVRP